MLLRVYIELMNTIVNLKDISACGVYAISNLLSGKKYIGSTGVSFRRRWTEHRRLLRNGQHHARQLQNSWSKNGELNFEFSILCVCDAVHVLEMEQYFIDFFNSGNCEFGYNQTPTAGSQLGIKRRPETLAKMSAAMMGKRMSPESEAKRVASFKKVKRTKEWGAAISRGLMDKKKSEQAKLNIKASQPKRIASRAGYRYSPETIEKIRLSNINIKAKNKLTFQQN